MSAGVCCCSQRGRVRPGPSPEALEPRPWELDRGHPQRLFSVTRLQRIQHSFRRGQCGTDSSVPCHGRQRVEGQVPCARCHRVLRPRYGGTSWLLRREGACTILLSVTHTVCEAWSMFWFQSGNTGLSQQCRSRDGRLWTPWISPWIEHTVF